MKTQCTEVFWIRLHLSTFEDPRWLVVEQLPEAEAIENIYTRLLMLAGKSNAGGLLFIYDHVPYTIDTLSAVLRRKKSVVELALSILIKFTFVELLDDVYAVMDWDRLQFSDDLAKIAERREKDKIRQRNNRQAQKLLSLGKSADTSTDNLRTSTLLKTKIKAKRKTKSEIENNNNAVVVDFAKCLLQKSWPLISTSATAIDAVAVALAIKGEDYVNDNIEYVRHKANNNPAKYLANALASDFAEHQQKSSQKALVTAERERKAKAEESQREEEDEEIRRWQASPEGQAELARLRDIGFEFIGPAP